MLVDNIVQKHKVIDGVTYSYDTAREKWLSVGTCQISYGINRRNVNISRWLAVATGIYSNNIGFRMPKNGTIVTAILQAKNRTTCRFVIKGENLTDILNLELNDEDGKTLELNLDFDEGTSLRCFLEIENNKIDFPFVVLECASRL